LTEIAAAAKPDWRDEIFAVLKAAEIAKSATCPTPGMPG
jgi:hypothetical protein